MARYQFSPPKIFWPHQKSIWTGKYIDNDFSDQG